MTILNDLAAELGIDPDALSATLTDGGDAETLTPNYLTTNADGTVSATFSGHVKASGVDIQGGQAASNAVRWLRNSDGSVIAQILGYDTADGTGPPKTGKLQLSVGGDATGTAGISASASKGTGASLKAMSLSVDALESGLVASSNLGLAAQKLVKIWNGGVLGQSANSDFAWASKALQVDGTNPNLFISVGFQAFTGLALAPGTFASLTLNHGIGSVPATFFPFITMQDAGSSVPYGTYVQASITATTFKVGIGNPYSFNLTNAQVGWAIIHS